VYRDKKWGSLMHQKKSPVLEKTILRIRGIIESLPAGNPLPSVRALSGKLTVSPVTIMKALGMLRNEGLISGRWGKCNCAGDAIQTEKNDNNEERGVFRRARNQFKQNIINGSYPTHLPLPPLNQLAIQYNISYPTIKKVLQSLVDECIIKRCGAKYYFFTNRTMLKARIAVVAFGLNRQAIKIETERERTFYRLLSSSALELNVEIEFISYNDYLDEPVFYTPETESLHYYLSQRGICGIILSSYHMNNSAECLSRLLTMNFPVSAWIEDSRILDSVEKYGTRYRKLTFFDSSYSTIPGYDVGTYLISKGHRHIAFLSPFHASPWSQNRLKGLKKAAVGQCGVSILPMVLTDAINDYTYMLKVLAKPDFEEYAITTALEHDIHHFLAPRIMSVKYAHDILRRDSLIFSSIKPLIDKIITDQEVTALVCVNDLIAGLVNEYWNDLRLTKELRPALIGFDNSFMSVEQQISTYEFNTQGEIQNMINHLRYPETSLYKKNLPVIRISGRVIERSSTN
jgi:DNA-binding transcriptional regulator YhcF (GntR family)/DNA-binding LacI/PurR family transcriptional regulator